MCKNSVIKQFVAQALYWLRQAAAIYEKSEAALKNIEGAA
jgi:hypothetical protein